MILELVFAFLMFADYKQTMDIKNHPGFYETNKFLGENPSDVRIRNYFVGATAAHAAVSYALPEEYRMYWQWGTIGVQTGVILHNRGIGLRINY